MHHDGLRKQRAPRGDNGEQKWEVLSMKTEIALKVKYGVWGLICGAIISMVIGFGWGGWTTAGTTQKMGETAVMASQTAICVAQFMKDGKNLEELEKVDRWKRSEFIEKGGWDKMPGQKESNFGVSRACAEGLEALIKK